VRKDVDCIPADGSGEVVLKDGSHLQHVRQQNVPVLGRGRYAGDAGKVEPVFLDVGHALAGTVGPIDHPEIVEVEVSRKMGFGDLGGEDFSKGIFLEDHLRDRQVDRFGIVRRVAVFVIR